MTRRERAVFAAMVLVLLGGSLYAGYRVRDWWLYRGEIAVDFDPDAPDVISRLPLAGFDQSPSGALAIVIKEDRSYVVETATHDVRAALGDVEAAAFVTDDVLVAFGGELMGPHEGMAVVDLVDESVDQVDDVAGTNSAVQPIRVTDHGLVVACEWHDASSDQWCEPERYLLDFETAELRLAPWSGRERPPPEYD